MKDIRDQGSFDTYPDSSEGSAFFPWALAEEHAWPTRTPEELRQMWASFALRHTAGLGVRTWRRLADRYGDPMGAVLAARRWVVDGVVSEKVAREFLSDSWRETARQEWDAVRDRGFALVLWTDPEYPQCLKEIAGPPLYLYRLGNPRLLQGPCVAVVGSRQVSDWGRAMAYDLGRDLSNAGVTVVSGMAKGVDRHAHLGAMTGIGSSIAVLGTGPDRIYPPSNRDVFHTLTHGGLVITEFSPGVAPAAGNFPVRNRIISALGLGVVVVEARRKSGALITARQALEQGREVFAVTPPENAVGFEGCAELIDDGAIPVRSARDIVAELGPLLEAELQGKSRKTGAKARGKPTSGRSGPPDTNGLQKTSDKYYQDGGKSISPDSSSENLKQTLSRALTLPASVGDDGLSLLSTMEDGAVVHVDELAERLEWDVSRVSRVLLLLEMEGLVKQWPGMRYSKGT
ncbi:DNA-processing protein DprA [Oceanidesulfovibrio marinus]|uniref:DNA-protecting protein DprA n=1 Tax=Oceanidesulfovibrio marinus TaxID=370038 RepID=A0A6P1ZF67_9BACT|nr:DNA-processing protein DprA [Oceanidesulfovibrio marinus]TVM33058.1 DNA-protecting protein DprA [Oceanidesulfovibrio marinus]